MSEIGPKEHKTMGSILKHYRNIQLKKTMLVLFEIEEMIRRIKSAVNIQEYCFQSHERGQTDINQPDLTEIIWDSIIINLFKYMEIYDNNKSLLNVAVSDKLGKKLYKNFKNDRVRELRHVTSHSYRYNFEDPTFESNMRADYLGDLKDRHKSLLAFYMKINVYGYIDDEPILSILIQIKNDLGLYIKSLKGE